MKFVNAHGIEYIPNEWLTFDDITLMPMPSSIASRNDKNLSLRTNLTAEIVLNSPLVSSNMDTVTESDMAIAMGKAGGCGILHRFYHPKYEEPYKKFMEDVNRILESGVQLAFSVGLSPEDLKTIEDVVKLCETKKHLPVVCVDVAKGDQDKVFHHIRKMKEVFGDRISVIGGNVCTTLGAQMLIQAGVSAIKVGVGPSGVCSTRVVTGHGLPQLSSIIQTRMAINSMQKNVALIADGGIRNSGDVVKALAAGADTVMIGSLFAGTNESSGLQSDGTYLYRGMSSKELNQELGKNNVAAEGICKVVPAKGAVRAILDEILGGIRSGMSYSNVKNLRDLNQKSVAVVVTNHGYTEGLPKHV